MCKLPELTRGTVLQAQCRFVCRGMKVRTVLEFLLAALIVIALGALSGWYFFLRGETQSRVTQDSARGFGTEAPTFAGALGSAYQNAVSTVFGGSKNQTETKNLPQLWQVDATPVAGAGFVQTDKGGRLYFAERSSGYIFAADPAMQTVVRLSNTLMPKTYEALFGRSGKVIERSVDETGSITTFAGSLATSSSASALQSLTGATLTKNIKEVAVSPSSDEIFYLVPDAGKTLGIRAKWDGSGPKRILTSGIGGWQVRWLSDGRIILLENPADNIAGFSYELEGSGISSLIGGLPGLTTLPRASSTALIYGTSSGGGLSLFARVSASSTAIQLPIKTVAEKCVWSPEKSLIAYCAVPQTAPIGNFLDNWYRGAVHVADAWWRVDVAAGSAQILYAPGSNLTLDVKNPVIDESGAYIAFTNNVDLSLWLLRINK